MSKTQPALCALRIGFEDYILPLTEGLKIVQLISEAKLAERDYGSSKGVYRLTGATVVCECTVIQPRQVFEQLALPAPNAGDRP